MSKESNIKVCNGKLLVRDCGDGTAIAICTIEEGAEAREKLEVLQVEIISQVMVMSRIINNKKFNDDALRSLGGVVASFQKAIKEQLNNE